MTAQHDEGSALIEPERRKGRRLTPVPRWLLSNTIAATALAGAAITAFCTTWFMLSPAVENADRGLLIGLVVGNIIIACAFALLVGYRLWLVLSDRRNQLAGSRTHLQLVGLFSVVAALPALIAFLFAFTTLRSSLNDVFGDRIDNYVRTSLDFTNTFFQDEANDAGVHLRQIELDLVRDQLVGLTPAASPIAFRKRMIEQAVGRGLAALVILDADRRIVSRVEMMAGAYTMPPAAVLNRIDQAARDNSAKDKWGNFDLNDETKIDFYRAVLKSEALGGGYILIYRVVPADLGSRLLAVRAMRDDWAIAKQGRARLERVFLAGYIVLAFIILFGAIWLALWAATRIVRPIGRLVRMSERVSAGDLRARVEVYKSDGELGALARSMNHMTAQLQTQRDDLIDTNKLVDRRRRFTEAVLAGVSAGILGVSSGGRLTLINRSAAELLRMNPQDAIGLEISTILPEISTLVEEAALTPFTEVSDQIDIVRDGRTRTLNVRIVSDEVDGERSHVVTFDDITSLISAQRSAAWGDVARRIAHEIKNPLTPIQLSAERLRRKYLGEIRTNPEIFDKCTETIIRHVGDIGRMVDEFSSFARMPKPVLDGEDMRELVKAAVFPQRVAFPDIDFETILPDHGAPVRCDERLIVQALGNLIKNAGEAIETRLTQDPGVKGRIRIVTDLSDGKVRVCVIDNGVGLPKAERHRLTEPYMTTRAKGTGLGLAIVRKVIEDHHGSLSFEDSSLLGETGAEVTLALPLDLEEPARRAAAE